MNVVVNMIWFHSSWNIYYLSTQLYMNSFTAPNINPFCYSPCVASELGAGKLVIVIII